MLVTLTLLLLDFQQFYLLGNIIPVFKGKHHSVQED